MTIYTRPEGAEPGASILERLRRTMEPIVNWDRESAPGFGGGPSYPPGPSGGPTDRGRDPNDPWIGPAVRVPPGGGGGGLGGYRGGGGMPGEPGFGGPLDWLRRRFEDAGGLAGLAAGARGGRLGRVLEGDFSRPSSWDDPKPQPWSPQSTNRRNWTTIGEQPEAEPVDPMAALTANMFQEGAGERRYATRQPPGSAFEDERISQDDYLSALTTNMRNQAEQWARRDANGDFVDADGNSMPGTAPRIDPRSGSPVPGSDINPFRYGQSKHTSGGTGYLDRAPGDAARRAAAPPPPPPPPRTSTPAPATDFQSRLAAMPPGGILEHVSDTPLDADAARRAGYLLVDRQGKPFTGVVPPGTPVLIVRDAGARPAPPAPGPSTPAPPAPGPSTPAPPGPSTPSTPATYRTGTVYDADGKVIFRGRINTSGTPSNDEDVYDVNPYNRPGSRVELD